MSIPEPIVSRSKRATNLEGNLKDFRANGEKYVQFLNDLRNALTGTQKYGDIKVTKNDDGVTKVVIKDGNTRIPFIFRNRDLYIIGFVLPSGASNVFYVDDEVYRSLSGKPPKLPASWTSVIGSASVVSLSIPLNYQNILTKDRVRINKMGESLQQLTQVGDSNKRYTITQTHLVPFVFAFSEALRFPVVAREVQAQFKKDGGELDIKKNILFPSGTGHPDQRKKTTYDIEWLLLNWGKLSDCVKQLYVDNGICSGFELRGERLNLEKGQLNNLVAVAASSSFRSGRIGRDVSFMAYQMARESNSPRQNVGQIAHDGKLESSTSQTASVAVQQLDVVGAIQLITVGLLYLTGRKLNSIEGTAHSYDQREAQAIAAELSTRIVCLTGTGENYEAAMTLQRKLASALIKGDSVEPIVASYVKDSLTRLKDDTVRNLMIDAIEKTVIYQLSKKNGFDMSEEDRPLLNECFLDENDIIDL